MKLLITGSRKLTNYETVKRAIQELETREGLKITMLLHGGAKGADTLAENWAAEKGIKTQVIKPNYEEHGKAAPLIRNKELVKLADITLALYATETRTGGTGHTASETIKVGKPLFEKFETENLKYTAPASKLF